MKKRIYRYMMMLTTMSIILLSFAICTVFYRYVSENIQDGLRHSMRIFENDTAESLTANSERLYGIDMRITLVSPSGTVIYDNEVSARTMPNHADREEIAQALEIGYSETKRHSLTMGEETYYCAMRLQDGFVLRLSRTTSSLFGTLWGILPIVACVVFLALIAGYIYAGYLTKKIIAPINNMELTTSLKVPYDELSPFALEIQRRQEHINSQLSDLKSSAATVRAIMDNMNEGIILADSRGVIMSVNKSALQMFRAGSQMNGRNILELLRDVELLEYVRRALSGERGEMTLEQGGKSYRVFFSPVTESGALILFLDVTEKARAEKRRREFSANVSHELKTPLTSIYGYAEMLTKGVVKPDDRPDFYQKIKDEAQRLITLIEDIIMISSLDESTSSTKNELIDIMEAAKKNVDSLKLKADENNVTLHITGESKFIRASASMIDEMLYNLIDNSIKYNKPGGDVTVSISHDNDSIILSVADTGIGIPKQAQDRVFERFYRVDKSRSKKTGGTGLGLAIVKHIVMALDGELSLESDEGNGTVITVRFDGRSR